MPGSFWNEPDPAATHVRRPEEEALSQFVQRPGATFIVGRPGTGKTTLLYQLLERARAEGKPVIVITPQEAAGSSWAASPAVSHVSELRNALIAVDEAHELPPDTLLDLVRMALESDAHIVFGTRESGYADHIAGHSGFAEHANIIRLGHWDKASLDELLRRITGADYDHVHEVLDTLTELSPREAIKAATELLERVDDLKQLEELSDEIVLNLVERQPVNSLSIVIDPGDASSKDLARFYAALSRVYRAYGGDGLEFDAEGERVTLREVSAS